MATVLAEIKNTKLTTEQAADHFCKTHWGIPRARTELTPDGRFMLANVVAYTHFVYQVSKDATGYLVWRL